MAVLGRGRGGAQPHPQFCSRPLPQFRDHARLSHRNSVCLSVTWVDQSKSGPS